MNEPVPFLGGRLAPRFERRVVSIAPGAERPYDAAEWSDAIVLVGRGEVDFVCAAGGWRRFAEGDVVYMAGLPIKVLRNAGPQPVVLVAISRSGWDQSRQVRGIPPGQ